MTIATSTTVLTGISRRRAYLALAAMGVAAAFLAAPAALADPADPALIPAPAPAAAPAAPSADPAAPTALADGVPHLPSLDNLPPGTTDAPTQTRSLGYLRDVLHAIANHDVTASDALLLLAQRPMSSTASAGQSATPSGPVGSSAALPVPPAAPADAPVSPPTP